MQKKWLWRTVCHIFNRGYLEKGLYWDAGKRNMEKEKLVIIGWQVGEVEESVMDI